MVGVVVALIPFIAVFIFTFQAYKTAVEFEKPIWWALVVFLAGFVLQLFVPGFLTLFLSVVLAVITGSSETFSSYADGILFVIWIVSVIISFAVMLNIVKRIATVTDENEAVNVPPPPTF